MRKFFYWSLLFLLFLPTLQANANDLRVMTFNIRYDNKEDGTQQWANRKESIAQYLHGTSADLIGMQEVLKNQLEDLKAMLPHHAYIGVGRDDGKEEGEYAPLFYDTRRFECKESGYFWLSETPETPSIGWDAACPRIVSWGYFYDRESHKEIACFNLHLDHVGQKARRKSLALLNERISPYLEAGVAVLVLGDFNASPSDTLMQSPLPLRDSYLLCDSKIGPNWTFHDFVQIPHIARERIDYIFCSSSLIPHCYQASHPEEEERTTFLSDHTPVLVTFGYQNESGQDIRQYLTWHNQYETTDIQHPTPTITKTPRNVVLMIGDGMGLSHIATLKALNGGRTNITSMATVVGLMTTHTADTLITDSAASATAMGTGVKTNYHYLGVDPEGRELYSLTDFAHDNGLKSGVISVCRLWDATPAAFCCHNRDRDESDDIMSDYARSNVDLVIGGGSEKLKDLHGQPLQLYKDLEDVGFNITTDMEELLAIREGRIFAALASNDLPTPQERGDYLQKASLFALNHLNHGGNGFFLMIEGSQLDDYGHSGDLPMLMEETADFDRTVGMVVEWARNNGETLVIVLADHETGGLTLVGGDKEEQKVVGKFSTNGHSGLLIPVYSFGPGAKLFGGIYDNTDIYHKITQLLSTSSSVSHKSGIFE